MQRELNSQSSLNCNLRNRFNDQSLVKKFLQSQAARRCLAIANTLVQVYKGKRPSHILGEVPSKNSEHILHHLSSVSRQVT